MTNLEWLHSLSVEELGNAILRGKCNLCVYQQSERRGGKMTNQEWIMTLNPQDLANNIHHNCRLCIYRDEDGCCSGELKCTKGILKWLEQEHKEELKPCPFCGSENVYLHSKDGYADETTVIFCNACKSTVFIEDNEEEGYDDKTIDRAIEAWNRRVDNG